MADFLVPNFEPKVESSNHNLVGYFRRTMGRIKVGKEVYLYKTHQDQFSSVTQSCPILCDPMDCSTPGFLGHYQLLELSQIHVYRVSDAIQPSQSLSPPSPPAFNFSQHQGLFQ